MATDGHNSMMDAYAEDKKCRICGFADTKNVNIFSASNCKSLLSKILTVYPIVLYQNDPLPKNICKKCVYNVSFMYNDIQRVIKTQSKWITNVRSVQPNHNYIRVLDLIENSNDETRESIKSTLGEDVFEHSINRLLLLTKSEHYTTQKETGATPQCRATETTAAPNNSSHPPAGSKVSSDCIKSSKKCETATKKKSPKKAPEIKDIKSILELNGCTLLTVGAAKKSTPNAKAAAAIQSNEAVIIKEEPPNEEAATVTISATVSSSAVVPATTTYSSSSSCSMLAPPPPLTVKCRYCPLQFKSLATLASHQLIHMRLSTPKIFEKKYLHKSVRRGRLIVVQGHKCIRCLNCWRVFVDNKSILDHWSLGECDFYCHICAKEFAQTPKMLREHVPAAHGISYRSSKMHRVRLSMKLLQSTEQKPAAEANADFKLYQSVSEHESTSLEAHDEDQSGSMQASTSKTKCTAPLAATKKSLPTTNPTLVAALSRNPNPTVFQQPTTSSSSSRKSKSGPIKHNDGTVSCHICLKTFNNYKARNSHMRKHKPSYAYGDMVLPPNAGVEDVYMKVENDGYYGSSSPTCASDTAAVSKLPPTQLNNSSDKILPTTPTTTSIQQNAASAMTSSSTLVVRGVRTKFVSRRSDLNPNATSSAGLKVKPISDLQSSGGGATHTVVRSTSTTVPLPKMCPEIVPTIKEEPMDMDTQY